MSIWRNAIDLRSSRHDKAHLCYHYTPDVAFNNIACNVFADAQLFASLKDECAMFGKGIYASSKEPSKWDSAEQLVRNNYRTQVKQRELPTGGEAASEDEAVKAWRQRAGSGRSAATSQNFTTMNIAILLKDQRKLDELEGLQKIGSDHPTL